MLKRSIKFSFSGILTLYPHLEHSELASKPLNLQTGRLATQPIQKQYAQKNLGCSPLIIYEGKPYLERTKFTNVASLRYIV